jgi:DNA-binding NtrC family response regulator
VALGNLLRLSRLERETASLRATLEPDRQIVGTGPAIERVRQFIERVAPSEGRVLLTGESGTGKELAARAVHHLSPRRDNPFVTVNCAAIPADLFESELFGHEKGAFTGAIKTRSGTFEQAHRGTLFLDEIGDMPLLMQSKLLRVLETGEVNCVGGSAPRRIDVRVIAATNRDLTRAVQKGEFRDDLFHRLNVVPIRLPALREHMEDFPDLVRHLLDNLSRGHGRRPHQVEPDALERLRARPWPGNVRELRNALERLVILTPGPVITLQDVDTFLPPTAGAGPGNLPAPGTLRDMLRDVEKQLIERGLVAHQGNVTATARALGLERSHLYKKMRELDVAREEE